MSFIGCRRGVSTKNTIFLTKSIKMILGCNVNKTSADSPDVQKFLKRRSRWNLIKKLHFTT